MVQCSDCVDCSGLANQSGLRGVHVGRDTIAAKFEAALEEAVKDRGEMKGVIPWIRAHGARTQ